MSVRRRLPVLGRLAALAAIAAGGMAAAQGAPAAAPVEASVEASVEAPGEAASPWSQMTSVELIAAAPEGAWRDLDPGLLMVLRFIPAGQTEAVQVVTLLAPQFAPDHVAALSGLLDRSFFDGLAIVRSQENYVAQWGDGAAAVAAGLRGAAIPAEFDVAIPAGFDPVPLPDGDVYAPRVGFWQGWPVAWDPAAGRMWLPHCNGMVGAGRGNEAGSGGPASLYAVNGHSPRALDRNVTLLGRVVQGMEHLTTLPRGTEALGFYGPAQARPQIVSARLASQLPLAEQPRLQALDTGHPIYAELLESRRNRRDGWTLHRAGRLEICNAPLPVRAAP